VFEYTGQMDVLGVCFDLIDTLWLHMETIESILWRDLLMNSFGTVPATVMHVFRDSRFGLVRSRQDDATMIVSGLLCLLAKT